MPLSKQEIDNLLRAIGLTQEREIDCQQCLARVAEFAETRLAGKSLSASLQAVEHHLSICDECREEYKALHRTLSEMQFSRGV